MPATLEYPWNGITVQGPLPTGGLGAFTDATARNIERVRVLLDPRVVMPPAVIATPLPNISAQVYGAPLDTNQSRNARTIIQRCYDRTALGDVTRRRRAAVMSIACALGESILYIYANSVIPESMAPGVYYEQVGSNLYSVGLFQQQVGPGFQYPNFSDAPYVMDPINSTNLWLDRLTAQANWWVDSGATAAGTTIRNAQQSATEAITLYASMMDEAEAIVAEVQFPPLAPPSSVVGQIPASIQTAILEIADGAQVAGTAPVNVGIEWVLNAAQWPTSATAGRRPRVADLTTFWGAMKTLVGSHAGTWGFSILNNPTFAETAAANADPHASMTSYANLTWSGGTDPATTDHQQACRWLEVLTAQVTSALRTSGFTKKIVVPTMYAPDHLRNIAAFHPNGPWINDANVWYETSFYPAYQSATQIDSSYATYNNRVGAALGTQVNGPYRASWIETAYYSDGSGTTAIINPEPLPLPPQDPLGLDPNGPGAAAPVPPVLTEAIAGDTESRGVWTKPTFDGGDPILGYTLTFTSETTEPRSETILGVDSLALTVTNLLNDIEYTVTVRAFNGAGQGLESNSKVVLNYAGAPKLPPPPLTGEEEPPPVPVVAPNLFAFYPATVEGGTGDFSPSNWAGL